MWILYWDKTFWLSEVFTCNTFLMLPLLSITKEIIYDENFSSFIMEATHKATLVISTAWNITYLGVIYFCTLPWKYNLKVTFGKFAYFICRELKESNKQTMFYALPRGSLFVPCRWLPHFVSPCLLGPSP